MKFIDDVITENVKAVGAATASGMVTELTYAEQQPVNENSAYVNLRTFIDILLLRGNVKVPLGKKLRLCTKSGGSRLVAADFITELSVLLKAAGVDQAEFENPNEWAVENDGYRNRGQVGRRNDSVTLDMNRSTFGQEEVEADPSPGVAYSPSSESSAEVEIRKTLREKYADLLTEVRSPGRNHYARRIISYDGKQVWCGTAWSPSGPWHNIVRDVTAMLTLGVPEP